MRIYTHNFQGKEMAAIRWNGPLTRAKETVHLLSRYAKNGSFINFIFKCNPEVTRHHFKSAPLLGVTCVRQRLPAFKCRWAWMRLCYNTGKRACEDLFFFLTEGQKRCFENTHMRVRTSFIMNQQRHSRSWSKWISC